MPRASHQKRSGLTVCGRGCGGVQTLAPRESKEVGWLYFQPPPDSSLNASATMSMPSSDYNCRHQHVGKSAQGQVKHGDRDRDRHIHSTHT
jgi:hypothetical protein